MNKSIFCDISCILVLLAITLVSGYFYCVSYKEKNERMLQNNQAPLSQIVSKLHVQTPRNSDPTLFESSVKTTK